MSTQKSFYGTFFRRGAHLCAVLFLGLLASCAKEETPPPQAETPKPSLVDQYKDTSKATAENPGLAGSPNQMKEEEKKEAAH